MTRHRHGAMAVLAVVLVAAACGGAPSATAPAAGATQAGPVGTAGSGAGPTPDQAVTPTAGGGGGDAGTFTGTACDLLTAAEVEAVTGWPNVAAQPTGPGSFEGQSQCGFVSDGVLPAVIVTVTGGDTNDDPESYLLLPDSVRLAVNGADAIWMPAAGYVAMVIKHGLVVAVGPITPAEEVDLEDAASELAQTVADRMP